MTPILTNSGHYVHTIDKGAIVAFIYKGEMRRGIVEKGDHRSALLLKTSEGFRNFSRTQIEDLSFITL